MHKPTQEDEYFAREDAEKLRKIAAQQRALLADDEKRSLRELHHLHCPSCGLKMGEVNYSGMKLDHCFGCGGTFLASGDLEKIARVDSGHVMNDILRLFEHKKTL
jgi:hypothetical protein